MAVAAGQTPSVVLVAVDDTVLAQLVRAATTDAEADEVTPPLTSGRAWTSERVAWLCDFHRVRRAGLAGPAGEATWAVVVDELVVGSVRLKHTDELGVLEMGIWLTRGSRGRGVGREATAAAVRQAASLGASGVRADTTVSNTGALVVLRHLGFTLTLSDDGQDVRALLQLDPEASGDECR
uniref:GCN5 family acetyltransferase n=1 Tax=Kocuria rosea subsp. polaris TaxID=136273 RepID=A0A0A6VME7_KOCRO|nr:GCN5 family acetyltransferase [Kocuria polaris]